MRKLFGLSIVLVIVFGGAVHAEEDAGWQHAFSTFGDVKYGPDFTHFDYANPDAPKGGSMSRALLGTYDSLNPFITKGTPSAASGLIYDTLFKSSWDEFATSYGSVAESLKVEEGSITYKMRPEAKFHDGHVMDAEDVVWTFNTLISKGAPLYRFYYANVDKVEVVDKHTVKFNLVPGNNEEMPLILGQLPVLPKHYWEDKEFDKTTLVPPLGSSAYKITEVDAGNRIVTERVKDYWGADLPINNGHYNIDKIEYQYFRDPTIALESFKAGNLDFRVEATSKFWATAYDIPAFKDGRIIKTAFDDDSVARFQAYAFNLRNPLFSDIRVRKAITQAWDFEWVNKNVTFGLFERLDSYFDNSELAATGLPSEAELKVLEPLRKQLPAEVFTETFTLPTTDGSGNNRENLRVAFDLFKEAGWEVIDGKMTNKESGEVMAFEILLNGDGLVPHTQSLVRNLKRLGVTVELRKVDHSQYVNRARQHDYDMRFVSYLQSLSLGNEQRDYWGSEAADNDDSRNYIGIKNPAIDELIEKIISSPNHESQVANSRALDRALVWNYYSIPAYFTSKTWVANWDIFGRPEISPKYNVVLSTWWIDQEKAKKLKR